MNSSEKTILTSRDGEALLYPHWLNQDEAEDYFQRLLKSISWTTETYTLYGKPVLAPRQVCWMGDANAVYRYSGLTHHPSPWLPDVLQLRDRIVQTIDASFNSVLANLYRDGRDSIGWHSDDEKELGVNPTIASLSLGESRLFKLRHKKTGEVISVDLNSGSLLVMRGALQHHWKHCLPKTTLAKSSRINLTFRQIAPLS